MPKLIRKHGRYLRRVARAIMRSVRFSRHARNRMRQSPRLTEGDIAAIIADPVREDQDADGRVRVTARVGSEFIRVVIAVEDPDFIVSVHRRRSP